MAGTAARHFRHLAERGLNSRQCLTRIAAGAVDQPGCEPLWIVEQDLEDVVGRKLLMPITQRERLSGLDEALGAVGVFFDVHRFFLRLVSPADKGAGATSS